jgi:hypothetical protein
MIFSLYTRKLEKKKLKNPTLKNARINGYFQARDVDENKTLIKPNHVVSVFKFQVYIMFRIFKFF